MNEGGKTQQAENLRLIPGGNGAFTAGMGMLVDKEDLGFGQRPWRYSMLVQEGIIEKMFIEPEEPGDPFKVLDAETMLCYLSPGYKRQCVSVFRKGGCPYCANAKTMLAEKGIPYDEIVIDEGASLRSLQAITGATTVPQVFIDGKSIGGSEALAEYLASHC
ncbi:glutaredoxin-like region [Thermostichus vulcanus NIES-2134]|nr:glutaredoxin-like region [Thermostichus vulcanus NIES-2134]